MLTSVNAVFCDTFNSHKMDNRCEDKHMKDYDVIVIGGGPAGLSAAIYTSRAELSTVILDEPDKLLRKAKKIDNYLGFPEGISGSELLDRGINQAERFGTVVVGDRALLVKLEGDKYVVKTAENSYKGKGLIIAPGIQHKKPLLEGIEELEGKGVSYCVTCDAPLFKDRKVGLIGSEDLVIKEALELFEYTSDIKIFTNGNDLDAADSLLKKLKIEDIPVVKDEIISVLGKDELEGLEMPYGVEKMDGLMIAEGTSGSLDFAKSLGIPIEDNTLVVDDKQFTGMPRVYAAGDCTGGVRQISASVGEGATAAINLIMELRDKKYVDWK